MKDWGTLPDQGDTSTKAVWDPRLDSGTEKSVSGSFENW